MKKTKNKNITTLTELIDHKYGKRGNKKREKWELGFKKFKQKSLNMKDSEVN
ncbi:MAG: hypothetical protein NTW92_05640 [Bacteroidetes bacterium]|jgi:hypothetical protein|nr:hypothetical protein [Bacteroidota bacterium]